MNFNRSYGPADQIKYIAEKSREELNQCLFGQIEFVIKAGRIFRVNLNRSLKLDDKILSESREASDAFKNHDYSSFNKKNDKEERMVTDEDGTKYPSVI